jgi:uncharacterized protein YfdQ (DUF2303 family)
MPETNVTSNENQALIEFATNQLGFEVEHVEDPREPDSTIPLAVVPKGKELKSLKPFFDEYLTQPERRKGRAALRTLDSLIDHANRFKDEDSVLFAVPDEKSPQLIAVIDYHRKGYAGRPRYGEHRGMYAFPLSEQWEAWNKIDGLPLDLTTFAEFLEDHVEDIVDPGGFKADSPTKLLADKLGVALASPAAVISASRGLSIHVKHDVSESRTLETGECVLNFTETHEPKGGVKIPAAFAISIPVFRAGVPYYVAVRLRYRISGAKVTWICSLYRTDVVFDAAFTEACTKAQTATGLPLLYGTPE